MSRALVTRRIGPGASIQDLGRPGYLTYGLSRGGSADRLAIMEGAALLGQGVTAAVEMPSGGGVFEATDDIRIALTGAPMKADIDGEKAVWGASHLLPKGAKLTLGRVEAGVFGYLSVGGGFVTPERLGSQSAHLGAGLGAALAVGEMLEVGPDDGGAVGLVLANDERFSGGTIRVVESAQSRIFGDETLARFEATTFKRDTRGNRMGVRILPDGDGFQTESGLSIVSEVIAPGDIQVTGDGTPFVLLAECQTTGGYPRIGSVLPADLPTVAQAAAGATLRFRFLSLEEAVEAERSARDAQAKRMRHPEPLVRDPRTMPDLLSYQLIGGVTDGETFVDGVF